jgi:hypothetical protein
MNRTSSQLEEGHVMELQREGGSVEAEALAPPTNFKCAYVST